MGNIFNEDFMDFIASLNQCDVKYMIIGGYAVILHGYSRTTGDLDIWVEKKEENYRKLENAFKKFGMPVFDMTKENFLDKDRFDVFTFGVPPASIDILTVVKGLEFHDAFNNSTLMDYEKIKLRLIDYRDLITLKRSSGRNRDLDDIENLGK